jgi:hypothetical protein
VSSGLLLFAIGGLSLPVEASAPSEPGGAPDGAAGKVETSSAWREATALEARATALTVNDPEAAKKVFLASAQRFEQIADETRGLGTPYWRSARSYWFLGELLPLEQKKERLRYFRAAEGLSQRGLDQDPVCAECMLWKFIAMGRIRTTRGLAAGIGGAAEMAQLLDQGIALRPTHRDGENNSTLGNLHYGSAIFYRVLPDWIWLGWFLGVRGDKERALDHARIALDLHPRRLDYRVEVGSQLLCLGAREDQPERLDEGARLLEELLEAETHSFRDERQIAAARIMLEAPTKSCGYTGDAWVEIDEHQAAAVSAPSD